MAQQPPTSAAPVPGVCQPGEPGRAVPLTPVTIKPIANAAMVAANHETPSSADTTQAPGEDGRACRAPLPGVGSCSAMSLIMQCRMARFQVDSAAYEYRVHGVQNVTAD
jgi:hypothetical protein